MTDKCLGNCQDRECIDAEYLQPVGVNCLPKTVVVVDAGILNKDIYGRSFKLCGERMDSIVIGHFKRVNVTILPVLCAGFL